MLERLDDIPWAEMEHAYGSAADVPELLRAMQTASLDLEREDSPLWNLFGNIWHQGTVYHATAYAVPFYGHFPCWGLPDTMREWRALASGKGLPPVDESLPLLANARYPQKDVVPGKLKIGQKVIHREFGSGKVIKVKAKRSGTDVVIHFDEEGVKELSLSNDASS